MHEKELMSALMLIFESYVINKQTLQTRAERSIVMKAPSESYCLTSFSPPIPRQVHIFHSRPGGHRHHHSLVVRQTHSQRLRSELLWPPSALRPGCGDEAVLKVFISVPFSAFLTFFK